MNRKFKVGDRVLLFNSRAKLFPGKLKSRWSGPFEVVAVFPYGTHEIKGSRESFIVNGYRVKLYHKGLGHVFRRIDEISFGELDLKGHA